MSQIIDGKKIAEKIKDDITQEIYKNNNERPNLAIILVGDRPDSKLYVNLKEKEAKKVGIDTHLYKYDVDVSEKELLEGIEYLNQDPLIDAILVQLPLPEQINADTIINAIQPEKDVDRFHPENIKNFSKENILPPVYEAIFEILNDVIDDLDKKKCSIVSNSKVFGDNLAKTLQNKNCLAQNFNKKSPKLKDELSKADILISAVGEAGFIKKDMVKKDSVVIDVGISNKNGKVYGDVDFNDVEDKTSFITPVPGGIGPLTIAMTFYNTLELYKRRRNKQ